MLTLKNNNLIKTAIKYIFNTTLLFITLNVFEVAQVIIVEGNTSFGCYTNYSNFWWISTLMASLFLLTLPRGLLLVNPNNKDIGFSKSPVTLGLYNSTSVLLLVLILNIIIYAKVAHILNFDYLNYINYSTNIFYLKNTEISAILSIFNQKIVFSAENIKNFSIFSIFRPSISEDIEIFKKLLNFLCFLTFVRKSESIEILNLYFNLKNEFRPGDYVFFKKPVITHYFMDNMGEYATFANKKVIWDVISLSFFKDGLTFWLLWLVSLVFFVISFGISKKIELKNKIFLNFHMYNHLLLSILVLTAICFSVKNILIFFIAFEIILIPLFLHIIFQGSRLNKIQAVRYLVIYTLVGSSFLWYSISYFIEIIGSSDFEQIKWIILESTSIGTKRILFICLFVGFAFKVPLVPFHHWLIIAHVEAPTNGSIILAALLLKVGGYGIYRFVYTLFPMEVVYFSNEILCLSLFGYTFATILATRQVDLKRYVAYTSIAHMNFSLLGLFSTYSVGVLGYVHMMISHGIIATAMFFLVGFIYGSLNFRDSIRISGLAYSYPKFSIFLFLFSIANMGLPLFSGFPGEFFIIVSIISNNAYFGLFIFFGFMFSGVYNFFQINKVLFSTNMNLLYIKKKDDLDATSLLILFVLLYWSIALGLFPDIITQNVEISV